MKEISLTRGFVAIVDDDDYVWLSKFCWSADIRGYASRAIPHPSKPGQSRPLYMHRILMGLESGDVRQVDHVDGDKLNNCRANLRVCTISNNQHNKGAYHNNTSGYKGVSWHKKHLRWQAKISVKGKQNYLGLFDTPEDAHAAYCAAAKRLHGEFANFGSAA